MAEEEVAASPTDHAHKKIPVVDVEEKRRRRPRFYYIPSSDDGDHRPATGRFLFSVLLLLLLLAGVTALVLYLVYRPSHPRFSVTAVSVYTLRNATAPSAATLPPAVSTSMQFTVVIRNPNDRASVHYDRLAAYVSYRGQAITPLLELPPLFQERDTAVTMSPVLGGAPVPVSADAASGLAADAAYGVVPLRLVVLGRVRYKSGPYHGGWHGMAVRCDVLVGVRQAGAGVQAPLLRAPDCDVDA